MGFSNSLMYFLRFTRAVEATIARRSGVFKPISFSISVGTDKRRDSIGPSTRTHVVYAATWPVYPRPPAGPRWKCATNDQQKTRRYPAAQLYRTRMYVRIYCTYPDVFIWPNTRHCVVRPGVKTPRTHYALCEGMCGSAAAVVRSRFHIVQG